MITIRNTPQIHTDALVVLMTEAQVKKSLVSITDQALKKSALGLITAGQFTGEAGQLFPVACGKQMLIVVGLGNGEKLSLTDLRIIARKALLSPYIATAKTIALIPHATDDMSIFALIEAATIGTYRWKKYISKAKTDKTIDDKHVTIIADTKQSYQTLITICANVNFARDLVNDNADLITSAYIEKTVRSLVKGKKNVSLDILGRKELTKKGLRLHLAVNQGSANEPKLIIITYRGAGKNDPFTAILGKGITFDTGGLNLKPSGHMETMRTDMSGAAATIGVLKNLLELKLKKNVIFACAIAENAIGSHAYKPGDIITSYSGKTVEIGNTDAEGRLVLADALSYLIKNYKPARIIDIATLTGACVVALGFDYTGLLTTDDTLAQKLLEAAAHTDDRVWRMPLYPEIKEAVRSKVADIKNIGLPKGAAGTITGAEFLRQFVGDTPWAHLDIAGTAFVDGGGRLYYSHGATGSGVRLLTYFIAHT